MLGFSWSGFEVDKHLYKGSKQSPQLMEYLMLNQSERQFFSSKFHNTPKVSVITPYSYNLKYLKFNSLIMLLRVELILKYIYLDILAIKKLKLFEIQLWMPYHFHLIVHYQYSYILYMNRNIYILHIMYYKCMYNT